MKHKIVFLDRATIEKNIVVRKPSFDHEWTDFDYTNHNDSKLILERLKGATIAIINKVPMRKENLKKLIYLSNKSSVRDLLLFSICANNKIKSPNIEKLINHLKPKYLLLANTFGQKSVGHFNYYKLNDCYGSAPQLAESIKVSRIFNNVLKKAGYTQIKTGLWNNRPNFWCQNEAV